MTFHSLLTLALTQRVGCHTGSRPKKQCSKFDCRMAEGFCQHSAKTCLRRRVQLGLYRARSVCIYQESLSNILQSAGDVYQVTTRNRRGRAYIASDYVVVSTFGKLSTFINSLPFIHLQYFVVLPLPNLFNTKHIYNSMMYSLATT